MDEENINVSYEIRITEGCAGTDPEAPDWEVAELENGVAKDSADIYDNLTLAEAQQIARMRTKKKEEAEDSADETLTIARLRHLTDAPAELTKPAADPNPTRKSG